MSSTRMRSMGFGLRLGGAGSLATEPFPKGRAEPGESTVALIGTSSNTRSQVSEWVRSTGTPVRVFATVDAYTRQHVPTVTGCVVLAAGLGANPLAAQERLQHLRVTLPLIILAERMDVTVATQAMRNGALDVLLPPFEQAVVLDRIREACDADAQRFCHARQVPQLRERFDRLTPREFEVLNKLVRGRAVKEIAHDLSLSPKTVQVHRTHIHDKTQTRTVPELIWLCLRAGVVSVDERGGHRSDARRRDAGR